jgi:hypothetical protein
MDRKFIVAVLLVVAAPMYAQGSKSEGEHGVPLMARVAAGTFGFLTFIQTLEGPER